MSRTVLVADDNLTVQRMASEILSEQGMDVVTVANGMAAIKKLPDVKPLVVVADVDMPGKNGYEVCDFVKSQPELGYVRVLLVVSDTDPLDGGRGAEVRADGIVKKPFDRQEFISIVVKSLDEALALRPPSAAHEPPAATTLPEGNSAHEDQNELTPHEPIEQTEILDLNKPNQPFENPRSEAPISSSASVAGKVLEDDLAVHSALDPAHGAASGAYSEIAIMSEEPELTSQESSEPPVVDWPSGLMALIPSLDSMATLDGAPPEHADPHVEGAETELLEPPLPDLAVLCADSHEEPVLEPVPLPDLAQLDAPEACFSEEQKVTALPDLDALPIYSAVEPAIEMAPVADFKQSGTSEAH
ncbi:MAG: response regulator [Terriglobia bacterium]